MADSKRPVLTLGEYQRSMERFEKSDGTTLPDIYLAVRIDAHRTGPEWDDTADEDYPFAPYFVEALASAAQDLMCSGFRVLYAFMHGDEITLLLDPSESLNQRRRGRIASLVASYGTVAFLRASHRPVVFHSQLSELPTSGHVIDYFMWQRKVATRNFFSRTLGIALTAQGLTAQEIDKKLRALTTDEERFALAAEVGIDTTQISRYHRFGLALWWQKLSNTDGFRLIISDELHESDEEHRDFLEQRLQGDVVLPDTPITEIPRQRVQMETRREPLRVESVEVGRATSSQRAVSNPSSNSSPSRSSPPPPKGPGEDRFRIGGVRGFRGGR